MEWVECFSFRSRKQYIHESVGSRYMTQLYGFKALHTWVCQHVNPAANNRSLIEDRALIIVNKGHLECLKSVLEQLDISNCSTLFPICKNKAFNFTDYNFDYWVLVFQLKVFVSRILRDFDFESENIYFSVSYEPLLMMQ